MIQRFLYLSLLILTMSACQSTSVVTPTGADLATADADALLRRAAQASGSQAIDLRILAARVLMFNGEHQRALEALAPLSLDALQASQRDAGARALAAVLLELGRSSEAEQALARIGELGSEDLVLVGRVCQAKGDYRCSADAYIQASLSASSDATWIPADINDRIWLALSRARSAPAAFTDSDHHAWWLLQERIRTAGSITGQLQAWRDWQNRYPNHPARLQPPLALRNLSDYQTPQIALMLPLSGTYGAAGTAVRDGLIAAYLTETGSDRPQVRIYDTAEVPIGQLYEQALREGASVIVGPLIRPEVEAFVELTQFSEVPRLVLNYLSADVDQHPDPATALSPSAPTPLFQFGIAIEDEATSLANHVLLNGLQHLLVVHSQERWSQRALTAYTNAWPYPVTTAPFAQIRDLTSAVGEAMQVAASESRKNEIADILGQPLEFLPRARGDLDGVIALTNQVQAQALVPALRFHFADQLPVFATSQAAIGEELGQLRGFELTEMPLFADPTEEHSALLQAFDLQGEPLGELYALGYDAYRLATWLPILQPTSQVALPGATGYLWLESGGKFRRDLGLSRIEQSGQRTPLN